MRLRARAFHEDKDTRRKHDVGYRKVCVEMGTYEYTIYGLLVVLRDAAISKTRQRIEASYQSRCSEIAVRVLVYKTIRGVLYGRGGENGDIGAESEVPATRASARSCCFCLTRERGGKLPYTRHINHGTAIITEKTYDTTPPMPTRKHDSEMWIATSNDSA